MSTTDPYDPVQRIADRLDAIDASLGLILQALQQLGEPLRVLSQPPMLPEITMPVATPRADDIIGPEPPTDAHVAFISGQWKRRQGDVIHGQKAGSVQRGPPDAPIDPWVRKVPAIREEEGYGETTSTEGR